MSKFGLGRGLGSLIPKKIEQKIIETSPVAEGLFDRVLQLDVGQISPNPHQPRKHFSHNELEDLANSIKEHGIIQPLIVTRRENGYELIAGERRLRAAKILGLKTVPAILRAAKKQEQLELALLENIQRSNLNPIEEAVAYQRLVNEFSLSHDELARRIGKSRPVITNTLRLLTLSQEIQRAIAEGKLNYSAARLLAGLPEADQMKIFTKLIRQELTVRDAEQEAKNVAYRRSPRTLKDPQAASAEEKLQEKLGTRVRIKKSLKGGEIVIHYYSDDELREIMRKIIS